MGAYADLQHGRVWYEEQGSGPPLVLIHGGAVDSRFFDKNIGPLGEHLRVIAVDLWGHGRSPDREGRFTLESFSMDVAEIIDGVAGGPAHVLGHSIGAAVGLDLVLRRPDLVQKLIQASGGFDISADAQAAIDIDRMVEQTVAFLGSTYGQVSPDGEAHFSTVVRKDFELTSREPVYSNAQVGGIQQPTLVMVADDDISSLEHSVDFYRALPNGELVVVPGTSHFLLQEKPELCNAIILDFLLNDPVATLAPVRRAPAPA